MKVLISNRDRRLQSKLFYDGHNNYGYTFITLKRGVTSKEKLDTDYNRNFLRAGRDIERETEKEWVKPNPGVSRRGIVISTPPLSPEFPQFWVVVY